MTADEKVAHLWGEVARLEDKMSHLKQELYSAEVQLAEALDEQEQGA